MGTGLEQDGEGSDRAEPRQRTGECTTCVAPNSTGCPEGLSPEGARQCIVQRDDGTQMGADVRPARREPRPGDDPAGSTSSAVRLAEMEEEIRQLKEMVKNNMNSEKDTTRKQPKAEEK